MRYLVLASIGVGVSWLAPRAHAQTCVIHGEHAELRALRVRPGDELPEFQLGIHRVRVDLDLGREPEARVRVDAAITFEARVRVRDVPFELQRATRDASGVVHASPETPIGVPVADGHLVRVPVHVSRDVLVRDARFGCDAVAIHATELPPWRPRPPVVREREGPTGGEIVVRVGNLRVVVPDEDIATAPALPRDTDAFVPDGTRWILRPGASSVRPTPESPNLVTMVVARGSHVEVDGGGAVSGLRRIRLDEPTGTLIGWVRATALRTPDDASYIGHSSGSGAGSGYGRGAMGFVGRGYYRGHAAIAHGTPVYTERSGRGRWGAVRSSEGIVVAAGSTDAWVGIVFAPGIEPPGRGDLTHAWVERSSVTFPAEAFQTREPRFADD